MKIEKRLSVCTMDCPDSCSLEVEVTEDAITKIGPSAVNPTTQGFICTKVSRFARRVYAPERLHFPMRRVGEKGAGKFVRITWEDAAESICQELRSIRDRWGGEAILPYSYGGSNGLLGQDTVDKAFFAKLGASRLARTVCAAPTTAAATGMYGKMPGAAFEDYEKSKLIVIWGANPKTSNIHLVPYLRKAKRSGAKIVVVDPVCNFSANEIDLHLPVYPGTDLLLALTIINSWERKNLLDRQFIASHTKHAEVLLAQARACPLEYAAEMARVDPRSIMQLAEWYARIGPAVIRIGWGLERNRNGGQAVAAILAMPALLGKFGQRGSGYTLSNGGAWTVDEKGAVDAEVWRTRTINMNKLGQVLLSEDSPPIKALFNYNCNPVATVPNQRAIIKGLMREDLFTVVSEQVMTDTARYADFLLPAVTFLEQREIRKAYGTYALQYTESAIQPIGESKPNEEMFAYLGRKMGWTDVAFDLDTAGYVDRVIGATSSVTGRADLSVLKQSKIAMPGFEGGTPVQFKNVFPLTPDGKVDFAPAQLGKQHFVYQPSRRPEYPLALISPATDKLISSTLGEFNLERLELTVHPKDAEDRNLNPGSRARVFNEMAELTVPVRVSRSVRPGVVILPKGAWCKSSANGLTATALSPDTISDVGGGACFNDARVEVEAI